MSAPTNQLVNKAEADMVAGIETSRQAYENSRWIVIAFAVGGILLALGLGYTISWSLIGPVKQIEAQLNQVAAGQFTHRIDVINRDELGALGADVNKMSEQLGRLYQQLRQRTDDLSESLQQQTATAEVLGVISRSKFELQPILQSVVDTAARLWHADEGVFFRLSRRPARFAAGHSVDPAYLEIERRTQLLPDEGTAVGRAVLHRKVARIDDAWTDPLYEKKEDAKIGGVRSMIGVPLMREGEPIGAIALARNRIEPFVDREIELVSTFADQAAIAIENVRL